MKKARTVLALLLIASAVLGIAACKPKGAAQDSGKLKIGVSLPTQREQRWVWDKEGFEAAAKAMGDVEILVQIADNNAARQQSQCENLITQGIKVLILAPHDEGAAKNIVDIARKAGVPVISYDRLVANADVDLYVTFDQFRIGYAMGDYMANNLGSGNIVFLKGDPGDSTCIPLAAGAKAAMQAKLDSGVYSIVLEQDCMDWEPSEALKHMEQALTLTNNNVQGVIAPNDGTAGGVIQALAAQGMAGSVIVTGQDCETDAIKRIIEGTQSMTVFFNCREMSGAAWEAAVKIARGQDPGATAVEDDGTYAVPTLPFPVTQITRDNYHEELIASGFFQESDFR